MATRPIYGTGENYGEIVGYEEIPDSQTSIAKQINVTPQLFQPMSDNYELPTDIAQKSTINGNLVNSFYDPQSGNLTGYSVDVGDTRVTYGPDGQVRNAQSLKGDFLKDITTELGPMALMALTMGGAGGLIGSAVNNALGMSLSTAAQSALGGALLGGGGAALTGGDVLKGALLGGAGGYAQGSGLFGGDPSIQAAMDADIAGGMVPEFGTNAAYDATMANLMANSPGAAAQLQGIVDSQVGGLYGPDNIDIGGGWNPANASDYSTSVASPRTDLPEASYSNEGRNYPTTESTQGTGGSPANASVATADGLPLVDTTTTSFNISPKTALDVAKLFTSLLAGNAASSVLTNQASQPAYLSDYKPQDSVPTYSPDYFNQVQNYYTGYMPNMPRDVSTPLQDWYNTGYT